MQIRYYKEYSRFLNRFMEFKVYGHAGRPIVIFPCQSGRFFDWEDRNMCNAAAPWIDSGKLQIFTVDSIDPESWDNNGPERPRIEMQERWYNYICEEFVPRLLEINREQGEDHTGCILTGGASMGGGHAVNFYLRRPDIFNGTIALSGLYSSGMFFGNYMDDLVYRNSPCDYMRNFPTTHPYMKLFEKADKFIMCCGQGAWEADLLASTKELQAILESKGIHPIVEHLGPGCLPRLVLVGEAVGLLPADDPGRRITNTVRNTILWIFGTMQQGAKALAAPLCAADGRAAAARAGAGGLWRAPRQMTSSTPPAPMPWCSSTVLTCRVCCGPRGTPTSTTMRTGRDSTFPALRWRFSPPSSATNIMVPRWSACCCRCFSACMGWHGAWCCVWTRRKGVCPGHWRCC